MSRTIEALGRAAHTLVSADLGPEGDVQAEADAAALRELAAALGDAPFLFCKRQWKDAPIVSCKCSSCRLAALLKEEETNGSS